MMDSNAEGKRVIQISEGRLLDNLLPSTSASYKETGVSILSRQRSSTSFISSDYDESDETDDDEQEPLYNKPVYCPSSGCNGFLYKVQFKNSMPHYKCTKCPKLPLASSVYQKDVPKRSPKAVIQCCIVPGCVNSTTRIAAWKSSIERNVTRPFPCHRHENFTCFCTEPFSMIPFPADQQLKRLWLQLIRRDQRYRFDSNKHAICSVHFVDEQVSSRIPFPIVDLGLTKQDFMAVLKLHYTAKYQLDKFSAILDECLSTDFAPHTFRPSASVKAQILDHDYKVNIPQEKKAECPPSSTIQDLSHQQSYTCKTEPVTDHDDLGRVSVSDGGPNISVAPSSSEQGKLPLTPSPIKLKNVPFLLNTSVPKIGIKVMSISRGIGKIVAVDQSTISSAQHALPVKSYAGSSVIATASSSSTTSENFTLKSGVQATTMAVLGSDTSSTHVPKLLDTDYVVGRELEVGCSGISIDPKLCVQPAPKSTAKRLRLTSDFSEASVLSSSQPTIDNRNIPDCPLDACVSNKVFCAQLMEEVRQLGRQVSEMNSRKRMLTDRRGANPTVTCDRCDSLRAKNGQVLKECKQMHMLLSGVPGVVMQELELRGRPPSFTNKLKQSLLGTAFRH